MTPEQEKQAQEDFTNRYMVVKEAAADTLINEYQVPEDEAHKIAEELINHQLAADVQQVEAQAPPAKQASTRQFKWHTKQAAAARKALAE
jgi:hypothetical protein